MTARANALVAVLATSAVVLVAFPAEALDGEILINQAKVNAGGITPGDTAGFPATLSRPGRYKLSGNLAVPAGVVGGIEVKANDVTIDLNGFTIFSAPAKAAATGIIAAYPSERFEGLRVRNGTIAEFQAGIDAGPNAEIENTRVINNVFGVYAERGSRISRNTIVNADGGANAVTCAASCLIAQNTISGERGIRLFDGGTVLENIIVSYTQEGLSCDPSGGTCGYGSNVLFFNNIGGGGISGPASQLHRNVCDPACP